ncbi:MAG: efflux RND transporter permease subunit [Marinilabiliales bacterium]|nr:efflux RND transporter permease subunit [Marinilabiliales bacterium]
MVSTRAGPLAARDRARSSPTRSRWSMRGLPGLAQMRSVTKFGISVVTLVFRRRRGHLLRPAAGVRAAGRGAGEGCPKGVEIDDGADRRRPWARSTSTRSKAEGRLTRSGHDRRPRRDLRTLQDWVVTPLLKSVPGVNEVNSFGGYCKQYQVMVDPERLLEVRPAGRGGATSASGSNNANVGGSIVERGVGAVHHPRRRPDPVGGRHPERSS